ncbi:MAG: F0F1 ATP synthase subunit gamma [Candidatus Omnitrophica bacterium]|nr:F0F1 ATP synthase subunit gamma [Candidatus Omnitrophota bacterium]
MEFNRSLSSLIEVLKNIAVAQYRILEQKIKTYHEFLTTVESFFELIDIQNIAHPFLKPKNQNQIILTITSDTGLLGGLNMEVINLALIELEKMPGKLVVVGEKGSYYARDFGVPFVFFKGIQEETRFSQAVQMRDYLLRRFLEENIGYLKIVYPHPVSFTVQRAYLESILPFKVPLEERTKVLGVILESQPFRLVEYLIYLWLGQKLYEIFSLSKLAEFAARFVHLEESTQKLKEQALKLRLQYFRLRHELIDRNMRELFSARILYR